MIVANTVVQTQLSGKENKTMVDGSCRDGKGTRSQLSASNESTGNIRCGLELWRFRRFQTSGDEWHDNLQHLLGSGSRQHPTKHRRKSATITTPRRCDEFDDLTVNPTEARCH